MKTFIIYNESNPSSVENANICKESFEKYSGWDVQMYDGCDPEKIYTYDAFYAVKDDRATYKSDSHPSYKSKKSCFYSHFDLWNKCRRLNKPIAIVEHDTECVGDAPLIEKDGVYHLSIETNILMPAHGRNVQRDKDIIASKDAGVYPMNELSQKNNHTGYHCLPGATAYVITPEAARSLIDDCRLKGWYQNDSLITTELVDLNYIVPSPIKYCVERELKSSSNWKA
jgi:hypothetical protein